MFSYSIIGSVVEALHLGQGVLNERTAKRFYDGESVSDYSRDQILGEFGKALVGLGLVPEPAFLEQHNTRFPFSELLTRTYPLTEVSQAFQYAVASRALRVGIRP